MILRRVLLVVTCLLWLACPVGAATTSPLFTRGYTVVPEPRMVTLRPADFRFGGEWRLELGKGVEGSGVAVQSLKEDLTARFQSSLVEGGGSASPALRLEVAAGAVTPGQALDRDRNEIASQAYRLELSPSLIRITANAPAGLFYGVETLVQLVKRRDDGLWLPEGEIVDWPDLELRQMYWDDAHHLEKLPELKRAVRQAAFFKINGFALKLEGHFQYASAPALVEPYALTPSELEELTDYGLRYYVQVIPFLDGPAHIAFILKHPEYAALRAFPDSNYELCVSNPDSYKLLLGMFDDLLTANKGVKYFYLSTDEPYYVGMADNAQCREARRAKELGSVGKLLAEFITKTAGYLHARGRTVIFWGEYPLKPDDIPSLPSHLVNGETYGPNFDPVFRRHGIRQTIYTSTQGEEPLFPEYFPLPPSLRLHPGSPGDGRVASGMNEISTNQGRRNADLMGVVVAGWADAGLHPETFWLGYAAITSAGWHPGSPDPREAMSAFYPLFYGPRAMAMDRVYQLMSFQAQIWNDTWERIDSTSRTPIWGNSDKIFAPPRPADDQAIPLPPVPSAHDLSYPGTWSKDNAARLRLAAEGLAENDELLGLLHENLRRVEWNRHSIEVFLSIAALCRQNLEMLVAVGHIDELLASASSAAGRQEREQAVEAMDRALEMARGIHTSRNSVLRDVTAAWYQSWWPRVAEANGRRYLDRVDDVKDHLPVRTVDMSYLVYRELILPFGDWYDKLQAARNQYAAAHRLPARTEPMAWRSLE